MKYKIRQYYKFIEPILYTKGYLNYGTSVQILENVTNSKNKEIEFESKLHYQIGERIKLGEDVFTIADIVKPINDSECIDLFLEDEIVYCHDYYKKSEEMISEFKLNNMEDVDEHFKSNTNWWRKLLKF